MKFTITVDAAASATTAIVAAVITNAAAVAAFVAVASQASATLKYLQGKFPFPVTNYWGSIYIYQQDTNLSILFWLLASCDDRSFGPVQISGGGSC